MATEQFSVQVGDWCRKAGSNAEKVVRKVALELFARVILRTPVDTGRARGNWFPSIGSPNQSVDTHVDPTGSGSTGRAGATVQSAKLGDVIYLTNNLPYIRRLEYGYSRQAPSGMVRLTVAEFKQIVDGAASGLP